MYYAASIMQRLLLSQNYAQNYGMLLVIFCLSAMC